jgi:hypothetical protein
VKLVVLAALLLVLAVPVAGAAGRSSQRGVLYGVVTRGPACSKGELHPCLAPLSGVTIVFLRHGHAVAQATTGGDGTYQIRLHTGRYGIRVPGHKRWAPARVRVWTGQVTRANIAVDTLSR